MTTALEGIRVLDLTRVLAGPWCAQNLADLGADVVKIERPGTGDDTRGWGPPFLKDDEGRDTADAAYYLAANRGKKSVTVDISTPEGQDIVRRLAADSDVLLENYKVGQLAKYGLDWESLRQVNPRLVYCSITGFGQTGPWSHRAGYDFIIQGIGGFMSITGEADGRPGGGPQKAGVAVSDLMTGMYATQAVLAALLARARTGRGQHLDVALLDVQVAMLANMNTNYLASGEPPVRWGNAHPNIVPYQTFRAADGWIIVAVGNDGQYARFCAAGGRPELAADPRFATNRGRVERRETLVPLLADMVATLPAAQWIARLEAAGVPCGPINDLAQVFENPQVIARGLRIDLPREEPGEDGGTRRATVRLVGNPVRFSDTPVRHGLPPPALGAHTAGVLADRLGLTDDEQAALRARGVI